MVPSNVYSKALYDLAEEIDKNEGCVTCSSVLVEGAAERIDMQTVTIRGLEIQRDELLAACEAVIAWDKARRFPIPYRVRDPIHAAIARAKKNHCGDSNNMVETSVPAIVFYPAGSLGEEVQP